MFDGEVQAMKGRFDMAKELVVTHFNESHTAELEARLTADKSVKRIEGVFSGKDLPEGKFWFKAPNRTGEDVLTVAVVASYDLAEMYKGLDPKKQEDTWRDGLKRREINHPTANSEKARLGLVKPSAKQQAVTDTKYKMFRKLVDKQGFDVKTARDCAEYDGPEKM